MWLCVHRRNWSNLRREKEDDDGYEQEHVEDKHTGTKKAKIESSD
jgi:hypothetical protein